MKFPLNLTFGSLEIDSHLLFEILAYSIGFRYYLSLRKKYSDPISNENRIWIFIGAVAGALIFSRVLGIIENFPVISSGNLTFIHYLSNKTIVGGLLGGLIGVEITKKIISVKASSGDLMAYPIILGMILGRIGCFLSGLKDGTYGIASDLPWAIDLGDGIRRHPTNLYEIVFLLLLWIFLAKLEKKKLTDGAKFKIFLSGYLLFRLLIEFIKPYPALIFGLSPIQLACVAGLIYYYQVFLFPKKLMINAL